MIMLILGLDDDGGPWKGNKAGDRPDEDNNLSEATV